MKQLCTQMQYVFVQRDERTSISLNKHEHLVRLYTEVSLDKAVLSYSHV